MAKAAQRRNRDRTKNLCAAAAVESSAMPPVKDISPPPPLWIRPLASQKKDLRGKSETLRPAGPIDPFAQPLPPDDDDNVPPSASMDKIMAAIVALGT